MIGRPYIFSLILKAEDRGTTAPTAEDDGFLGVAVIDGTARLYFAVGGAMYYVDGTSIIAVPIANGMPMGLLLSLTYAGI